MAYRIRYGDLSRKDRKKPSPVAFQALCAGVLLCLVLMGNLLSNQWEACVRELFLPSQELTWFREYAEGQSIRQMLVEQCRGVLIEAGYEE